MDSSSWIAVVAAIISVGALVVSAYQTRLQKAMHEDAAQPYVWADIQPDDGHGGLLKVVVKNTGPTVARNIRVDIDPPLPDWHRTDRDHFAGLRRGVSALAPGRWMIWNLGVTFEVLTDAKIRPYNITVNAEGPFGPVPELKYTLDLSQMTEMAAQPPGNLHAVAVALNDIERAVKGRRDAPTGSP